MKLLLSNDDGIDAPGITALFGVLQEGRDLWVSAPAGQCSAQSHAFSLGKTLRVDHRSPTRVAVAGTPADAVYFGLYGLLDSPPDWVISGVNAGSNLGTDVHYSGTVAAAMEGCIHGIHALAASLHGVEKDPQADFGPGARLVARVLDVLAPLLDGHAATCWNLNIPNCQETEIRGVRLAALCKRQYVPHVKIVDSGDGFSMVRLGGPHLRFYGPDNADGPMVFDGYATLTPLHWNWTDQKYLSEVGGISEALAKL